MKVSALESGLRIVDDFYEQEYGALLEFAGESKYKEWYTPFGTYRGICLSFSEWARLKFCEILGVDVIVKLEFMRKYEHGMPQDTFIHSDFGLSEWSATMSLARPGAYNGFFCLWRHVETGVSEFGYQHFEHEETLKKDGFEEEKWEMTHMIEMIPNRCVVYPAAVFHSRYPRDWKMDYPRLVQVFFMDRMYKNER